MKNAPPSATPKLTVPVPVLSSAPSRLPAAPSAQCAVAGSVSQTPPPPAAAEATGTGVGDAAASVPADLSYRHKHLPPPRTSAPVTFTVCFAPSAPLSFPTLRITDLSGKLTVALAEVPSAKFAVSVK